ncbi:hypothetical protein ABL78_5184 [Leptomonas seymouri]|uniref:Uncharacterized protein n=1 Tax=Leptomonas seymouri TaxID=5684 RepID=A0A0N0P4W4_LEPSE|nr:hypothetical protein ABL78_5184 [Leptomonas seymouri]|eukprot:KPI85766.1 hypothetical protein ABL78_5184 [Leptomonas seymouri]
MASVATHIAEWFRKHLSSAVTFQKQFVDDVEEKVKEQKAQFDRHSREANDRAIQLHLDQLEEKYLCCVCGRGGEAREDDEYVYDTYSMISLPPRMTLEAAVREELADAEMMDERIKQHQSELAVRQRRDNQVGAAPLATQMRYSDKDSDKSSSASTSSSQSRASSSNGRRVRHKNLKGKGRRQQHGGGGPRSGRHHMPSHKETGHRQCKNRSRDSTGANRSASASPAGSASLAAAAARQGRQQTTPGENQFGELAVMDPDMVGPLEVRNMLFKIRHAVLRKESRTRRKAVAVHKDKGLMKIEDSEIDMFSHFFQRPVHGYLCSACYTCARRRLDLLTQQIRGILFKAQNPILRRVPSKEIEALRSSNQVPLVLVESILTVQRRWANMLEEERALIRGAEAVAGAAQTPAAALANEERTSWSVQVDGETVPMGSLPEKCILRLREEAKCGACQRRSACFFEQRSIVFLCQFCTARDRFYRENAVCINDEAMPLRLVHMLQDFDSYYHSLQQQMELRGAPQSAIDKAQTDLFPLTEVLREREGLFACLAPAVASGGAQSRRELMGEDAAYVGEAAQKTTALVAEGPMAAPSTFAVANRTGSAVKAPLSEQRERVGRTMVSLFDGVRIASSGIDLFSTPVASTMAAPAPPATASATGAPPAVLPQDADTTDLFDFSALSAQSAEPAASSAPARRTLSTSAPLACGTGSSTTPNSDWEGLF